mmetsp:Transcript_20161/g.35838  ORF Transcript_20161/g.35838 Transcript_20161/m.35838 type:complete len:744 (-) Transcript_20161:43-2274(-)|eukprot:CAMPEP_0184547162 /NCGR_PEP_ID=MMETSP0199_2-20130426/5396_1 /TAXON_ID=1112570 /ORGANISM="Thraustochytrium sp., Strain LLF1b" /LENGTH=743 /DNA_ID=CAMNT_0026941625 /DNA_START=189 /DNA_END=2420 /DNA_ORIENTATION=-
MLSRPALTSGLRLGTARKNVAFFSSAAGSRYTLEKVGDIGVITMDEPGSKVNTISSKMQQDFAAMLDTIENDESIKAAILISGKKDNFIAGADIKELANFKTPEDGANASKDGQKLLARVADSKKPFIAAINGSCLGGGLEVALHCHYRIATSNPKTKIGLPEVQLGLLPGAGGTQRLPPVIGMQASLDMILTGKTLKADRAKKMGVVHEVVDPYALRTSALAAAREIVDGQLKPKNKNKGLMGKLLEDNPIGRHILFDQATKMALKKSGGNYPAIPKILEVLKTGAESGLQAGLDAESKAFGELSKTSECNALQGLFFGSTALKKNRFGKPETPVTTIGILGAGLMGAGIAQVSAQRGFKVLLKDLNQEGLGRGLKQIQGNLDGSVKRRRMTPYDRDVTMSRIVGLTNDDDWKQHFKNCDLVVEAVLEDVNLKHKVIQELEEVIPEHAVIATNTSAIPIRDIAAGSKRPERVIGMHYFSPVDKMPLLEVIKAEGITSDDAAAAVVSVGIKQGKTVVPAGDRPGFYVNRSLSPMLASCISLVQSGVPISDIDKAMTSYGFPVGPVNLADEVGIDVAYHVQETLNKDLGIRMSGSDPNMLKEFMDAGLFGRKSGKGFFLYDKKQKGKPVNPEAQTIIQKYVKGEPKKFDTKTIQQRIAFPFINEAAYCLQDGIIDNAVDGDIGAVFGIGYPPFRGGPFRQLDQMGIQNFVETMDEYKEKYGPQYEVAPILREYAAEKKTFHKTV